MAEEAERVTSILGENTEVVGITLGRGLSRGYADELSEIDLNIYVKEASFRGGILSHVKFE